MKQPERGIGLVEAGVALVVLAVVIVAAAPAILGSRSSEREVTVRKVAARYEEAIEAYRADNGGDAPVIGQTSWPSGEIGNGPLDSTSSTDTAPGGIPYLTGGIPEEVATRQVSINVAGTGESGKFGRIEYRPGATPSKPYELRVRLLEDGTWRTLCTLGTANTRGTRC